MARTKQSSAKGRTKTGASQRKRSGGNGHSQSRHMIENLEEGFVAEVADMLHAERQILSALPKMAQAATQPRLRSAIEEHHDETQEQIRRLERVFQFLSQKPHAEVCEGMKGILEEGREQMQKTPKGPVRDAMIIASCQKVEHYEIASYGTLTAWADELGEFEVVRLLEQSLDEEKNADRILSRIAEGSSNRQAEWGESHSGMSDRGRRGSAFTRSRGDDDRGRDRSFDSERGGRPLAPYRDRDRWEPESRERGRFRSQREREWDE